MNNNFTKGIITGICVGAAVSMIIDPKNERRARAFRKQMNRTVRTIGSVINNMM